MRAFEITEEGIVMGETLGKYEGLLTGSPELIRSTSLQAVDQKRRRAHGAAARR
jgi:hypothetical protein